MLNFRLVLLEGKGLFFHGATYNGTTEAARDCRDLIAAVSYCFFKAGERGADAQQDAHGRELNRLTDEIDTEE